MLAAGGCGAEALPPRLAVPFEVTLPPGGPLESLGGLVLNDDALGFGGISGLHLADDLRITAVSDLGRWLRARLVLDASGHAAGLAEYRSGRLRDGGGQPLTRGQGGDAEALARLPNGHWLVGFERWHRIRRYADIDGPGVYVEGPPGLTDAPANAGLESLTVLADGRWLAVAEGFNAPGMPDARRAWLGQPGRWLQLAYHPAGGFNPTDAAALPDGGALLLERHFSLFGGFRCRLVRLSAAQLAGATTTTVLEPEELLRLEPPLPTDNYEALGVARVGSRVLVALVSDDNQNPLQRSLLLLFALR